MDDSTINLIINEILVNKCSLAQPMHTAPSRVRPARHVIVSQHLQSLNMGCDWASESPASITGAGQIKQMNCC